MAKYCGVIGFGYTSEDTPGVWVEHIKTRSYYGDLIRNSRRLQSTDKVNDDINISNQISVVLDPYLEQNFHTIRYVTFMGEKWKVTDVEVNYPRLTMTLGGLYNESETGTSRTSC